MSEERVAVDPTNVEMITNWKQLKTVIEVRSFLGLVRYYRHFIEVFARLARPLTALTLMDYKFV